MVVVTDHSDTACISNPVIQAFVSARMLQLAPVTAPDEPDATCDATFVVVEAGDAVSELDQAVGFAILRSLFDDLPFGHHDYYPPFEIMEEHSYDNTRIYELVFIGNDDGAATAIIVSDEEGIDADLLAMCRSFATPAVSSP